MEKVFEKREKTKEVLISPNMFHALVKVASTHTLRSRMGTRRKNHFSIPDTWRSLDRWCTVGRASVAYCKSTDPPISAINDC